MGKKLSLRFTIPKGKIKNANMAMNYIVSASKSSWIRDYAKDIWDTEIKNQFNITAKEPTIEKLPIDQETQKAIDHIETLKKEVEEANLLFKQHNENNEEYKKQKKLFRLKNTDEKTRKIAENYIFNYEEKLTNLKTLKNRRNVTLRNFKKIQDKEIKKKIRKNTEENKRNYIKEKIKINKFQHIFKTCYVVITVNNITNRDFDSPNYYPTVKPIIDAGTDTGILWEDDNNNIIKSMIFLAGKNVDRNNYIIDIDIYEDFKNMMEEIEV